MFDPARYTEDFSREQGFALADWLQVLPGAVAPHALQLNPGRDAATVPLATGTLHLSWQVLPPRRIALMRMPRLQVRYQFSGVARAERQAFMRRFDLFTQRGGG